MAKRPNTTTDLFDEAAVDNTVAASEPNDLRKSSFEVVAHQANRSLLVKDMARKKLAHVYSKEPKVSVMVAPMYAAHFGRVMHVSINGISVAIP